MHLPFKNTWCKVLFRARFSVVIVFAGTTRAVLLVAKKLGAALQ
jgi:hypothetical protein